MFVPIGLLLQNEKRVSSAEDLVQVLDRWVLPNYPDFSSANPGLTKAECMGVLHSYYVAGKIHYRITPEDVETAVNAFLEDRLWVSTATLAEIELVATQDPSYWLIKPTFFRCMSALPRVFLEAVSVSLDLVKTGIMFTIYSWMPAKKFVLPKAPTVVGRSGNKSGDKSS